MRPPQSERYFLVANTAWCVVAGSVLSVPVCGGACHGMARQGKGQRRENLSSGVFNQRGIMGNMVRARITICGTRPLLQHEFGEDAIPLEKAERTGVAGNDPEEWKRTCQVDNNGLLFIKDIQVFGCLRDAAKHTKKGRGSIQPLVAATLQVEDTIILLNRSMPAEGDPPKKDRSAPVYIDVCGVRNPATKARNVRYRLAASKGWEATFVILWDKTLVAREQMKTVLRDAGILCGIGDGRSVGNGRFEIAKYEELSDAEETPAEGSLASPATDRVGKGRKKVSEVLDGVTS